MAGPSHVHTNGIVGSMYISFVEFQPGHVPLKIVSSALRDSSATEAVLRSAAIARPAAYTSRKSAWGGAISFFVFEAGSPPLIGLAVRCRDRSLRRSASPASLHTVERSGRDIDQIDCGWRGVSAVRGPLAAVGVAGGDARLIRVVAGFDRDRSSAWYRCRRAPSVRAARCRRRASNCSPRNRR